jgi:hypothetical protein
LFSLLTNSHNFIELQKYQKFKMVDAFKMANIFGSSIQVNPLLFIYKDLKDLSLKKVKKNQYGGFI